MIRVRRLNRSDPLYAQEVDLRERVLLRPVGLDMAGFEREFPGAEARFEHFVAVDRSAQGERVVGCALLLPNYPEPGAGKLMQMAVDPQRQAEGIGRTLVVAVEARAFAELGLVELFCHARHDAVGFYDHLGWQVDGEPFDEVGIAHRRMVLRATDPADPAAAAETSLELDDDLF